MKYEVISGPIALEGNITANNGDVIILSEADGKALVQYQILKEAAEDAIAINDPNPPAEEPAETAAQKKKRLAEEEAAAKAAPAPEVAKAAPVATAPAA